MGPLFDTHVHGGFLHKHVQSGSVTDSSEVLFSYLDEDQVRWMMMYYVASPTAPSQGRYFERTTEFMENAQSRVIFLHGVARNEAFAEGMYDEDVLRERLQPHGPFHGVGEITLYRPEFKSVTFTSPEMQAVYRVVNEMGGVVMIHPRYGPGGSLDRPEDPIELEEVIKTNSNITFLFHGRADASEQLILPLMGEYPNVYYTYDVIYMLAHLPLQYGDQHVLPHGNPPDAVGQFLSNVDQIGIDTIVQRGIDHTAPWFKQHPDRILWGTDRFSWMWEKPASDKFVEIGRRFIARLPAEHQEAYAYKNALRVFGKYLIPKQ